MQYYAELDQTIRYLNSPKAFQSIKADAYWPKWHSPWWHMLLLHEMGETHQIPESLVLAYIESVKRYPIQNFPTHPHHFPPGTDFSSPMMCHCQVGTLYQVLHKRGVDVDQELPWLRHWFTDYQMEDGGMSCDNDAYRVWNETPSSMVGLIGMFEAMVLCTDRQYTPEENVFLKKGAQFLIDRKLMLGSLTKYNADERESAKNWFKLTFPRFYFYDVLRGLNALVAWSKKTGGVIPQEAISTVVNHMKTQFPDGNVRIGRRGYDLHTKTFIAEDGWTGRHPSLKFSLLEKVSTVGDISPFLSKQWDAIRK